MVPSSGAQPDRLGDRPLPVTQCGSMGCSQGRLIGKRQVRRPWCGCRVKASEERSPTSSCWPTSEVLGR
jgi:hypothetical protein